MSVRKKKGHKKKNNYKKYKKHEEEKSKFRRKKLNGASRKIPSVPSRRLAKGWSQAWKKYSSIKLETLCVIWSLAH